MSETTVSLRRKTSSAEDLQSVVRTMKALAGSSIGQYEQSVRAIGDYHHAVELGLSMSFHENRATPRMPKGQNAASTIGAVVFGSDQGLVGQFNDVIVDYATQALAAMQGQPQIWAVGELAYTRLADAGLPMVGLFHVPNSVQAITPLAGQILVESVARQGDVAELHLFYNRPTAGAVYEPIQQQLLPLDEIWRRALIERPWPTKNLPEVVGDKIATLRALISEYLFVSLFRACAESLASENASRMAAMERADENIDDMLESLRSSYNQIRQADIDEELFDVISGFEALSKTAER